jgi:hypothetical protein
MSIAPAWQECLAFFGTPLVIEPSPGQLSGDAGPAHGGEGRQLCPTIANDLFAQKGDTPPQLPGPVRRFHLRDYSASLEENGCGGRQNAGCNA